MPPPLLRIDHIHVFVSNRAAAEAWYAATLGLTRVDSLAFWAGDGGPLTLGDAAGNIHIALFERPVIECRSTIALAVGAEDFLAWRTHLAAVLGHGLEVEDHALSWSLYFADPDGNPYEITTYDYAPVAEQLHCER